MIRTILCASLVGGIAACGSSGSNDAMVVPEPGLTPEEIAMTERFDDTQAEADRVSMLDVTPLMDIPTGTVSFEGQLIGDTTDLRDINRVPARALADITLQVGFTSQEVTGSIDNFAYRFEVGVFGVAQGPVPVTSGSIIDGKLDVVANGPVDSVDRDGQPYPPSFVRVELNGTVRNDGAGLAIFGDAALDVEGDYDGVIPDDGNGTFHLTEAPTPP